MNTAPEFKLIDLMRGTIGMLDFGRAATLSHLLLSVHDTPGDLVEFGCYEGKTAMLMAALAPHKRLVLYDSFEGLPERSPMDTGRHDLCPGALKANPITLRQNFENAGLPQPEIVNGWFDQIHEFELPKLISFASIDSDYYKSTVTALRLVYPRLVKGAVVVVDDYGAKDLPGVEMAVEYFMLELHEELVVPPNSVQAYFVKK